MMSEYMLIILYADHGVDEYSMISMSTVQCDYVTMVLIT